jgi:tRNA (guanine-N7-)-methyltransferase
MRPEDLKPPFPKEDRKIVIHDHVWYVPPPHFSQSDYQFLGWSHTDFFGNDNPVNVEYCSGNGAWVADQALANPDINWIAIEKKFLRVRKIWSKIKNLKLKNLIVLCGEGYLATQRYFPSNSINEVYVNFPDPWPKKRHAKNRIFQPEFVNELARIITPKQKVTFVTDDPDYSEEVISIFANDKQFQSFYPAPFYAEEDQAYGSSYFEELWRSKGKTIRYHRFTKV